MTNIPKTNTPKTPETSIPEVGIPEAGIPETGAQTPQSPAEPTAPLVDAAQAPNAFAQPSQSYMEVEDGKVVNIVVGNPGGSAYVLRPEGAQIGDSYDTETKVWTPNLAPWWQTLREERNALLSQSDWTQIPDSSLPDRDKTIWRNYRRALRDLPANTKDPCNPVWATPPGKEGAKS